MLYGAIEAGGTKMVLAVGDEKGKIQKQQVLKTGNPEDTLLLIKAFFRQYKIAALGIGSFGPVEIRRESPMYGTILNSPKTVWNGVSWIQEMGEGESFPICVDTDVNVACLGEVLYGNGKGLQNVIYLTVGTGVGAGIWAEGRLLHGMLHPEAGHILISRRDDDVFEGCCPYHTHCLEGMASGTALRERYNVGAEDLAEHIDVWQLEADYLAQALANYILCYSPQRIILGGGVMKQERLFPLIRQKVEEYLNGYVGSRELCDMNSYIVPAGLDGEQGVKGALALASMMQRQ